jgi:hypothetical protein
MSPEAKATQDLIFEGRAKGKELRGGFAMQAAVKKRLARDAAIKADLPGKARAAAKQAMKKTLRLVNRSSAQKRSTADPVGKSRSLSTVKPKSTVKPLNGSATKFKSTLGVG